MFNGVMKMDRTQQAILFVMMLLFVLGESSEERESLFHPEKGHTLSNHVIKSLVVHDVIDCGSKCLQEEVCKSVNYEHSNTEKPQCQLNDKRKGAVSGVDYQSTPGFTYYEKDPCVPSPCSYAGTCSKINGIEEFKCTCLPGFKGRLCELERLGWFSRYPGASCKAILDAGDALYDGAYWIDPGTQGQPLRVYCDQTAVGGGWLLVSNTVIQNSSQPPLTSLTSSFRDIANYNNNRTLASPSSLRELRQVMPFTQMRFQCWKAAVGRTLHVITAQNSSGTAVLDYLTAETNTRAVACGSFTRGPDDNSMLSTRCSNWGTTSDGKWGHRSITTSWRIYDHTIYIPNNYHWIISPTRYRCDANTASISPGDYWKIFVR